MQAGPAVLGQMAPLGGGDPIPLVKRELLVGRRESCDIVLRFANVSAHHCLLFLDAGYWYVRDLKSRNGTRVGGVRVAETMRLDPGDELTIARHCYEFLYSPIELGAVGPPPDDASEIFSQSLIERLGLDRRPRTSPVASAEPRRRELLADARGTQTDAADAWTDSDGAAQ